MIPFYFAQGDNPDNVGAVAAVDEAIRWTDQVWAKISDTDMWLNIMFSSIRILIIFIITRIVIKVVSRVIDRSMARKQEEQNARQPA